MGQENSRESQITDDERQEAEILKERVEREGPEAVVQHIRENLDRWKSEEVYIGIIGRTYTGKSTFINAVLGLHPSHEAAASVGSGNTTQEVRRYPNPRNPSMVLFDFPGVGTPEFPRSSYMTYINSSKCQYFLIFFDSVITEDDMRIAENLKAKNLPFSFVRSKIDENLDNASFDGKSESEVMAEVRQKATDTISSKPVISGSDIFFISGRYTFRGEFSQLLSHMEENFSAEKFDSVIFSISSMTTDVVEQKYSKLKKRIRIVSVGAAGISAQPLPLLDLAINLGIIIHEINHYISTFGLGRENLENVPEHVRNRLTLQNILWGSESVMRQFIINSVGKMAAVLVLESVAEIIMPVIGGLISAPTTFSVVYKFLDKLLGQLRDDALTVYQNVVQAETSI